MVPTDGIVVGLYGPWGSGKTTLLNFVTHYLGETEEGTRPIVVRFNPWWFSGDEDLTRRFFDQLRVTISEKAKGEKALEAAAAKLGQFADLVAKAPLPYAGTAGKVVGGVARAVAAPKDLYSLKAEVEELLRSQSRRILVLIDDIDRLTAEEVRQLFRLVKAVGDFPKVVYLLVFDQTVVAGALKQVQGASGEDYLEKIVQVPFVLPHPDRTLLRQLLLEQLSRITGDVPEDLFDQSHWTGLYFDGIDPFIVTPRDVVRLCNTLRVTYPAVAGDVNAADFIAVETLRVFAPEAYELIRQNQEAFAARDTPAPWDRVDDAAAKSFHDAWIARVRDADRQPVRQLAQRLFPRLQAVWAGAHHGLDSRAAWRRAARVCSPDHFPIYFQLAVPATTISPTEMRATLTLASDADAFGAKLLELARQKTPTGSTRARVLLEQLEDHTRDLPETSIAPIVSALFAVGDRLLLPEDEPVGILSWGNDVRIGRVVYQLLHRVDEPRRFALLRDAIAGSDAIAVVVKEVASLSRDHGRAARREAKPEDEREMTLDHVLVLEELVLEKLRAAATAGALLQTPRLANILYRWRDWAEARGEGSPDEPSWWVQTVVGDDQDLARLLEQLLGYTTVESGGPPRRIPRLDPELLRPFVDPALVIERVRALASSRSLTEAQRRATAQFVHEYDLRQRGVDPTDEEE
jgi:predicted KAP-like P-loop ATPase